MTERFSPEAIQLALESTLREIGIVLADVKPFERLWEIPSDRDMIPNSEDNVAAFEAKLRPRNQLRLSERMKLRANVNQTWMIIPTHARCLTAFTREMDLEIIELINSNIDENGPLEYWHAFAVQPRNGSYTSDLKHLPSELIHVRASLILRFNIILREVRPDVKY